MVSASTSFTCASPHESARPLILTHGWPGSVVEFLDVIGPLTEPENPEDAFHVVVPSLPGYGFSDKPTAAGVGIERIAEAWDELMTALGYSQLLRPGRRLGFGGDDGDGGSAAHRTARHPPELRDRLTEGTGHAR